MKDLSWAEWLRKLTANGKIEQAAVVHLDGRTLGCSSGLSLSKEDINALLYLYNGHYYSLMKMKFCGHSFIFLWNSKFREAVIGRCEDRILVMQRHQGVVILGISRICTPGSSLYELYSFIQKVSRRKSWKVPIKGNCYQS